jgi:glycosyltransferase involved in cell wall biosynthesis
MGVSIILRNKNYSHIKECLEQFSNLGYDSYEIVMIDSSSTPTSPPADIKISIQQIEVSRTEALKIGVSLAKYDKILILDADQRISSSLLFEIDDMEHEMIIVPEKSLNKNLVGILMDAKRSYLFNYSKLNGGPKIPVIPRIYNKKLFQSSINQIQDQELEVVTQHEDSLIYYEAYKNSRNIGYCNNFILNHDPTMSDFLLSSYKYGLANQKALDSEFVTAEHKMLIKLLDRQRVVFNKELGLNYGIMADIAKGIPYILGTIVAKFTTRY